MSMMAAFLVTLSFVPQADVELLFFTSAACPPCRQMEPVVTHLQREGYAIQKIDVMQRPDISDRYGIRQTPTFVLVRQGQPIETMVGATSIQGLRQLFRQAGFDPTQPTQQAPRQANAASGFAQAPPSYPPGGPTEPRSVNANPVSYNRNDGASYGSQPPLSAEIDHGAMQAAGATNGAMERAMLATVRIRVAEQGGSGVGTGTVIHQRGNEALVLTCGHLFRESQGQGRITVEYGFPSRSRIVEGRLLGFDADKHDTALVVVRVDEPLVTVPVALPDYCPMEGDLVFSVGCDRGADPTVRESRVKALTYYSDVLKYDVHGRPIDGRSGGGLFTAGGQLIGVCNAAAVDIDEGLYAAVPSLHQQFQETGLATVFADPARLPKSIPSQPRSEQLAQNDPANASNNAASLSMNAPANLNATPSVVANEVGRSVSIQGESTQGERGLVLAPASRFGQGSDLEVIVLVRSTQDPSQMETRVIRNPSPELLASLRAMGAVAETARGESLSPGYQSTPETRMGRLPSAGQRQYQPNGNTIQPPADGPTYRAQSPN